MFAKKRLSRWIITLLLIKFSLATWVATSWASNQKAQQDLHEVSHPEKVERTTAVSATSAPKVAPPGPLGPELIVNTETSKAQRFPSIAALGPDRGFVVVWQSEGQDSDGSDGIYGQRFDSRGTRVVDLNTGAPLEFQISPTPRHQRHPSVAALANGGFVVTWTSYEPDNSTNIYARRYGTSGLPLGAVFQVSPAVGNQHIMSAVTGLSNGNFVVTWTSDKDTGSMDIFGQIFDPLGAIGPTMFEVNEQSSPNYEQNDSAVIGLAHGGGFVAAWESNDDSAGGMNIYMRLFDSLGAPQISNKLVNTIGLFEGHDLNPAVALSRGGFVVTWTDKGKQNVQGNLYRTNGDPHPGTGTEDFRIAEQSVFTFDHSDVAGIAGHGFIVTWVDEQPTTPGIAKVYGKRFNSNGVAIEDAVTVSEPSSTPPTNPRVAELGDGTIAFVWMGHDGHSHGILSRLFAWPEGTPES